MRHVGIWRKSLFYQNFILTNKSSMHINKLFSLKDQCAVVVGGSGKIGFPMAQALAEAGAKVYIASRNKKNYQAAVDKLKSEELNVEGVVLDQSDEASVCQVVEKISKDFKAPDILINSGYYRPMQKFFHDTPDNWDKSMEVNARGLFVTCRAFGNAMVKECKGSIINLSSIYGIVAPDMGIYDGSDFETEPDYPFIKGGVISFSKYLSSYYSKKNVRVNCISPGGFFNNQKEPFLSKYIAKTPLSRMASHDDMKGVALFLASDASSYITGCVIPVDGGWTVV
jgi:NAD(P)-dependent dehydrogenase (short-subunit alcohol dehydrogenase family)